MKPLRLELDMFRIVSIHPTAVGIVGDLYALPVFLEKFVVLRWKSLNIKT